MIALLVIAVIVVVLLVAYWFTMRDQASKGLEPTLAEHAAADAGRTSPAGTVGAHDAGATGPPAFLDEVELQDEPSRDVR